MKRRNMPNSENIYQYFWLAQVNAQSENESEKKLAFLNYEKVVEIGERNMKANKNILAKAYAFLGHYEATRRNDDARALVWFEKLLEMEPGNEEAGKFRDLLKERMNNKT